MSLTHSLILYNIKQYKQKNVCKDAFLLCGIEKEKNNEDTVFQQVSKIL